MTFGFPAIEPYDNGMLDVGDGHRVYWECCGNPAGKPAIYLHGGPGSGCAPSARRYFDPETFRVVLFDQRGSGRGRPLAREPDIDLSTNTTAHLIADIEQLRRLHGVDKWTVLGISCRWSTPTRSCSSTPTLPSGSTQHGSGAAGKTPTSPSPPITRPAGATKIPKFVSSSPLLSLP
jgi:proline iminopeptidase